MKLICNHNGSVNTGYLRQLVMIESAAILLPLETDTLQPMEILIQNEYEAYRFKFESKSSFYSIKSEQDISEISIELALAQNIPNLHQWLMDNLQRDFHVLLEDRNGERLGIFAKNVGLTLAYKRSILDRNIISIILSNKLVNAVYSLTDTPEEYFKGRDFGLDFNVAFG